MLKKYAFKKSLLGILLVGTLAGCNLNKNNKDIEHNAAKIELNKNEKENIDSANINKNSWKNVEEYNSFVQSKVNEYFVSDVTEIYNFYNIDRSLPNYGFKQKKNEITAFWDRAVYKEKEDSIYFYLLSSEELFKRYSRFLQKTQENPRKELEDRIHYFISHEAAHAYYYRVARESAGEGDYLFKVKRKNTSRLYDIQHNLVEEGVAEYMSHKGEFTEDMKNLKVDDKDFKKMIENKVNTYLDGFYLYSLGFILVKPILDIDFKRGIEELIKNPLTRDDLDDLPRYRENIRRKVLREYVEEEIMPKIK